jgi:hypothetical protein
MAAASTFSAGWRLGAERRRLQAFRAGSDPFGLVAQKAAPEMVGFRAFPSEIPG